jgi:hypothetical protein
LGIPICCSIRCLMTLLSLTISDLVDYLYDIYRCDYILIDLEYRYSDISRRYDYLYDYYRSDYYIIDIEYRSFDQSRRYDYIISIDVTII